MAKPRRGEVWLVRFPFTDLTSTKLRPALVWAVHGEDIIVVGIFSRVPAGTLRKSWLLIEDQHSDFSRIGLKKTSVVKAEKIAVVHESVFQKKLGSLPTKLMVQVQKALERALLIS
ncbi:MAG: type II toxin-antitoxin system PemK/MazF family toxin [Proteobacteria bacterium]|nr:type II toxin-antitoxin system PemK/MazF family toxin [Pseudomonadota bacterium]